MGYKYRQKEKLLPNIGSSFRNFQLAGDLLRFLIALQNSIRSYEAQKLITERSRTGSTGFEPAVFALTGRRVNQATPRPQWPATVMIQN